MFGGEFRATRSDRQVCFFYLFVVIHRIQKITMCPKELRSDRPVKENLLNHHGVRVCEVQNKCLMASDNRGSLEI